MPDALPIAGDGCGNFWIVDMAAGTWGPIYFCCHDAPVALLQAGSLAEFLSEVFKMYAPPHQSLVDDVHSDRIFEMWLKNPGVLSHEVAIASPDTMIRKFEWGRSGPPDAMRRIGAEPIFGLPQDAEKKSLFARLFGR